MRMAVALLPHDVVYGSPTTMMAPQPAFVHAASHVPTVSLTTCIDSIPENIPHCVPVAYHPAHKFFVLVHAFPLQRTFVHATAHVPTIISPHMHSSRLRSQLYCGSSACLVR